MPPEYNRHSNSSENPIESAESLASNEVSQEPRLENHEAQRDSERLSAQIEVARRMRSVFDEAYAQVVKSAIAAGSIAPEISYREVLRETYKDLQPRLSEYRSRGQVLEYLTLKGMTGSANRLQFVALGEDWEMLKHARGLLTTAQNADLDLALIELSDQAMYRLLIAANEQDMTLGELLAAGFQQSSSEENAIRFTNAIGSITDAAFERSEGQLLDSLEEAKQAEEQAWRSANEIEGWLRRDNRQRTGSANEWPSPEIDQEPERAGAIKKLQETVAIANEAKRQVAAIQQMMILQHKR